MRLKSKPQLSALPAIILGMAAENELLSISFKQIYLITTIPYNSVNKFMRNQQLKQSKILIKTSTYRSDVDDQIQFENPENNFQKLMSLQEETPVKQFRNIIQSMLENCSFEKNIIRKISQSQVPNYVKSQIKRREIYDDYQTIKSYANFLKKKKHFQTRKFTSVAEKTRPVVQISRDRTKSPKNRYKNNQKQTSFKQSIVSKPTNLLEFVNNKKRHMLMEDNILKVGQQKVNNILKDNKKRQKIFEQALFLQRLYDIQIQKLKEVGVAQNTYQVPEKFKGIDPRHIRINSEICQSEDEYLRKRYVFKKRKLQFYGHARKIQQSSLKTKKLQNLGVLSTIMSFNEAKSTTKASEVKPIVKLNCSTLSSSDSGQKTVSLNSYQQDLKIKRLFLKYTCCESENPEQMFKYLGQKQLNEFLIDFDLQQKKATNQELQQFLEKKKQEGYRLSKIHFENEAKIKFFFFDFLEILYILASEYENEKKSICNITAFLENQIWPKQNKVVPIHWIRLKKIKRSQRMTKLMKMLRVSESAHLLFESKSKKNVKNQSEFSSPLLSFNDVLQIAWQLKIFPLKISKKSLRFIYLYCKSYQNGVSEQDFLDLLLVVGLKFAPFQQKAIEEKIKWIASEINF